MDKPFLIKSVFMFICIWGIGIMLLWFRRSIEIFWKIVATLILCFYIWFFFEEISAGYHTFITATGWYNLLLNFLTELTAVVFANLFFLWPAALVVVFYKADEIKASRLLKFMCILTIGLWIVFLIFAFSKNGLDDFIMKNLKQMFPKVK
jgi:hypothetical protein